MGVRKQLLLKMQYLCEVERLSGIRLLPFEHQAKIHGTGLRSFWSMKYAGRPWGRGEMEWVTAGGLQNMGHRVSGREKHIMRIITWTFFSFDTS